MISCRVLTHYQHNFYRARVKVKHLHTARIDFLPGITDEFVRTRKLNSGTIQDIAMQLTPGITYEIVRDNNHHDAV